MTDQTEKNPHVAGPEDGDAPWELPNREAMSVIGSGSAMPLPGVDGALPTADTTGTAPAPTPDAAGTAGQATSTADDYTGTTGGASGGGTESITSDDRSDTFSDSDSAYAES